MADDNTCAVPEYLENQKSGKWVDPEHDEDTEDAVGLKACVPNPFFFFF